MEKHMLLESKRDPNRYKGERKSKQVKKKLGRQRMRGGQENKIEIMRKNKKKKRKRKNRVRK